MTEPVVQRKKLALRRVVPAPTMPELLEPAPAPEAMPKVHTGARLSGASVVRVDAALARLRTLLLDDDKVRLAIEAALAEGELVHARLVLKPGVSGVHAHADVRTVRPLRGTPLPAPAANDDGAPAVAA